MSWQYSVGRLVAFIGAFMVGWGIISMAGIVDFDNGYEFLILGAIILVGGLFFSLLGGKQSPHP